MRADRESALVFQLSLLRNCEWIVGYSEVIVGRRDEVLVSWITGNLGRGTNFGGCRVYQEPVTPQAATALAGLVLLANKASRCS